MTKELMEEALALTTKWGIELDEFIPVPGAALSPEWKGSAPGTTRVPGRNRPPVGAWLFERYFPEGKIVCSDPMIGAGCLWTSIDPTRIAHLYGIDIEQDCVDIAQKNLETYKARIENNNAVSWVPREETPQNPKRKVRFPRMQLVMTSHPFKQSHSSGDTDHQKEIRDKKYFHNAQGFGSSLGNIANAKNEADRWNRTIQSYHRIRESLRHDGLAIIILRNYIKDRQEQPEVEKHIWAMRMAGLWPVIGHPRYLERPLSYNAWKVAADPTFPWVKLEWAICIYRGVR